jgi:hypothetical protein
MPPEVHKLGRAIDKWSEKICNYHIAKMTNGPGRRSRTDKSG